MATPSSTSRPAAPAKVPGPDLSWFCCICCVRRPIPQASFSMLLTTCSHIVCSSCWTARTGGGSSGECPSCGANANTLNLTTVRPTPKQLEPYFKSPVELVSAMLSAYQFQEHQKRQSLRWRKAAWVLINHGRAKQDYEREYAQCKELQSRLGQQKSSLRQVVECFHKRGVDPVQELRGKFSDDVIKELLASSAPPSNSAAPTPTPFLTTPLRGLPSATSTPAVPGTHAPGGVEFGEPKRLPHTMRGSVTSLTVRRSPSNPPTPLSQLPPFASGSAGSTSLPVTQRVQAITPVLHRPAPSNQQPSQRQSMGPQPMEVGTSHTQSRDIPINVARPIRQSGFRTGQNLTPAGRRASVSAMPPGVQSHTLPGSHQLPVGRQFFQPTVQSGRPTQQPGRPTPQFGQPVMNSSRPTPQSVRPPTWQFGPRPQMQPAATSPHPTPQQFSRPQAGHPAGVRIRAVSPSSAPPYRFFPSPSPSLNSQRSHDSQRSAGSTRTRGHSTPLTSRIVIRPPPSLAPLSQAVAQLHSLPHGHHPSSSPRGRAKTPTNPSPLLTSVTTPRSSSPWQRGQRSQGSPWKQGRTRLSESGRGPRLTPMKS